MKPDILVLDEPFNGLDEKTKATITMLKRIQMGKILVLLWLHITVLKARHCVNKGFNCLELLPTLMREGELKHDCYFEYAVNKIGKKKLYQKKN